MTTFIFICALFLGAGTLIYQHRCFEDERCETMNELCILLETMGREVASLSTHPVFLGLGESCPYLSRRGVIVALSEAADIGTCMCELLPRLSLDDTVGELLVGYFSSFGHGERSGEYEQLSQLLSRMRTLAEEQKAASKNRERAFDVMVACCALCAAIVAI